MKLGLHLTTCHCTENILQSYPEFLSKSVEGNDQIVKERMVSPQQTHRAKDRI
jgi:hypothetical protein